MPSKLHSISDSEWSQNDNRTLATKYQATSAVVSQFRRLRGKPKGPRSPGSGRPQKLALNEIDWSLSNNENAKKLGCTPSYITILRRSRKETDFA
jgi:hypothetical protein